MRKSFAIAALAAAALAFAPASAAFAGGNPSPSPSCTPVPTPHASPSVTPQFGYNPCPTPVPTPKAQNWQFDLQESNIGAIATDDVEGTGAIPMVAWKDVQLSAVLDKFVLGGNSVTLKHPALPFPVVNLRTCTLEFNQVAPFRIVSGTGIAAGAVSRNGRYVLQGLISFPYVTKYRAQVCPLGYASLYAVYRAILSNSSYLPGLPAPTFTDFAVQGDASVTLPVVLPAPTPTYTYPSHS